MMIAECNKRRFEMTKRRMLAMGTCISLITLIVGACASGTTKTMTLTEVGIPVTSPGSTVLKTQVVVVTLTTTPPDMPHPSTMQGGEEYMPCSECHGIPKGHEDRVEMYNPDLCLGCHQVSPDMATQPYFPGLG
jgi:hypothetical protein